MAFPSLSCEIDWDRDGVWTDVTPYLLSFRVRRGRQHELGRTEPGRGTVTLRNEDRRFDPTHTDSPYAPNVIPTRPIRIRASKGGKLGAALSFDGTNDRVDVAHASVFNLTGDLTIEAWVKTTNFASFRMIVTKDSGGSNRTFNLSIEQTTGKPFFTQSVAGVVSTVTATDPVATNDWSHIAVVKSGTTVTHYLNGVANGSGTISGAIDTNTQPVRFGTRDPLDFFHLGLLDDIRIWNVARSQADTARDMDRELTGTESGLVGYWKLNGSGTTATDSTANANHGTLTNGPTWVDSAYDIFRGFTGGWNPTYPEFGRSTVVVEVFDALALFNLAELRNPYVMEVLADSPRAYYRLNETGGTTAADASGNRRNGTYSGGPIFSQSDPITDDVNGAVSFDGVNDIVALPDAAALSGTAVSLELWIKHGVVPEESNNKWPLAQFLNGVTTSGTRFELVRSGANIGKIAWLIDQANILISTGRVDDNAWHHIVGTYDGTTMRLYVDGAQVATLAVTTTVTARSIAIGGWPGDPGSVHAWDALVDEVALYSTTLSAARVSAHYDARNAWLNDTTGQRIGRVLDRIGWAAGDRNIDTGDTSLSSAPEMDGETALAHLTKIAHTEAGLLWITGAGVVRFVSRRNLLRSPYNVSQATFGDGAGELPYIELLPEQDEQEIYNVTRVTRQGGITAVARAAQADIDRYGGERVLSETIHANTDGEAQDRADWNLAHFKDAAVRFRRMKTRAHAGSTDALWTQILSRDLGDRLTVVRRPSGGGAAMSQAVRVNALEHALVGQQWETTYELAPVGADSWIWDTSTWDTTTRWAY